MYIEVVGADGSKDAVSRIICMRLGERVLIDAGSASLLSADQLDSVDSVLLTHGHLDHILDLGFILDSMVAFRDRPLVVMGSEACLSIVRTHYMNGLLWPDFSRITAGDHPVLEYRVMPDMVWTLLPGGVDCMAVPVNHPAGARGFLFREGSGLVVYSGDTGPTDLIWRTAVQEGNPSSVFIEVSFPESKRNVAMASDHLCPSLARDELKKLGSSSLPVNVFHMKPWFAAEIASEIGILGRNARLLHSGDRVQFTI